jgi:hypothetical protein
MKVMLLFGLVCGFAGMLAGAHYYPWMEHERVPSKTSVQPNGGRVEQFVIRLPADRIDGAGGSSGGRVGVVLPAPLEARPLELDHFKLRDVDGNVIGVAARHWTRSAEGAAGAWWIVIPSRGAMLLAGDGAASPALDQALAAAGRRQGLAWSGDVTVTETNSGASRIVLGSQEFAGLEGGYSERWRITGVNAEGELRGTIELATVTHSGA